MKANEFKKISTHKVNPSSGLSGDQNLVNLISEASSLGALSLHDHESAASLEVRSKLSVRRVSKLRHISCSP